MSDRYFFKIVVDGQERDGDQLKKWLDDNINDYVSNEEFGERAYYNAGDIQSPPPTAPVTGAQGAASWPEASFLYLDVGCWIGSDGADGGKWGAADKKGIRRDFGIVAGPLAVLCTFSHGYPNPTDHHQSWKDLAGKSDPHIKSVATLLDKLSAAHPKLGKACVRRALVADSAQPQWPSDPKQWTVHVVMGDMHIPCVATKEDTYSDRDKPIVAISNNPKVPRHGRVDIGPLEHIMKELVPDPNSAGGLEKLLKLAQILMKSRAAQAAAVAALPLEVLTALQIGARELVVIEALRDGSGIANNEMSPSDAEKWFKYYIEGVDGGLPANIFENAGDHLFAFALGLEAYATARAGDDSLLPLQFHQLGDMVDYWIGFTCHFKPGGGGVDPHGAADDAKPDYGLDLVNYWTKVLFSTPQGDRVDQALEKFENHSPVYLWGNHDNYLGGGLTPSYTTARRSTALQRRVGSFDDKGIFMEHGHQRDDFNMDSAAPKPTSLIDGTNCTLGVFLTQAAFIRPKPIRGFEGTAGAFAAKASGGVGGRLTQVKASADMFLNSGRFYVYVMGHTHRALLSRIVVRTNARVGLLDKFKQDKDSKDTAVWFAEGPGGDPVGSDMWQGNYYGESTLKVGWKTMPGFEEHDWVSLEDPAAPDYTYTKNMFRFVGDGNHDIPSCVFPCDRHGNSSKGIPPGRYEARAYIDRFDQTAFKRSTYKYAIYGMSIEGDGDNVQCTHFEFGPDGNGVVVFEPKIMLRWAWAGEKLDANPDMWIGLFKKNEGKWGDLQRSQHRPWKYFRDLFASHPGYGRYALDEDDRFGPFFQAHPGSWELRAYYDDAGERLAAKIDIEVKKKKPK